MIAITVIGDPLHQWELGRKVRISPWVDLSVDEVHFAKDGDTEALVVEPKEENGVITAEIPNILLQTTTNIVVYAVQAFEGCEKALDSCVLSVTPRPKPANYVYTETETKAYKVLEDRIRYLEQNGVSSEQIVKAVSDYLTENPVEVDHPVKYIESPKDDKVCLRDLESGNYVLYGYFTPFPNSSSTLIIDNMLMHLYRSDAGTYMTSIAADGEITVYEILVDETSANGYTYTRKKYNQNETITEITEEATDEQVATAKAVHDLFHTVHSNEDFHITRIESLEETGIRNLRELDSGIYILYGYFNAYPDAPTYMPFDNRLVSIEKQTAGSHLFVFQTLNAKVDFHEILVEETAEGGFIHTSTQIDLLAMHNEVNAPPAKIGEVNLLAKNWIGVDNLYSQVVNLDGVTENSQVDLTPSVEQLAIFYDKSLAFVAENEDGVVTVYAIGQKPENDYTIQVTITEVSV